MKLILTAGTLLLFCAYFNEVHACTCLDYGAPTCSLFAGADAVFVGKIERITSAMGDNDASRASPTRQLCEQHHRKVLCFFPFELRHRVNVGVGPGLYRYLSISVHEWLPAHHFAGEDRFPFVRARTFSQRSPA